MNTYQWNAEDYAHNSKAQQAWARELIAKLEVVGSESVLDVGCGDGKVTAEIASRLAHGSVVGVDNSPSMITLAAARFPPGEFPNLSFQLMDASSLQFRERFDVIFSNAALHWVKDHKPVVEGMYRSLKGGGRILLQMGGKGNAQEILSSLATVQENPEWRQYFDDFVFPYGFLGVEDYQALLTDAGFAIDRVELVPKDMLHAGRSALEGWIRTTWLPYTERVPTHRRDAFIASIADKYLEVAPADHDGTIHVPMVRIEVAARKG